MTTSSGDTLLSARWPPGDNFTPRRQSSLLGDNFAHGGQSLPLGAKLRMGLCSCSYIYAALSKLKLFIP
jgi:hypothetical protein